MVKNHEDGAKITVGIVVSMGASLPGALRVHEDDGGESSGRTSGEAGAGASALDFRLIRERSEGEAKCTKGDVVGFVADGEWFEMETLEGQRGNAERSRGDARKANDSRCVVHLGETDSQEYATPSSLKHNQRHESFPDGLHLESRLG